MIQDELKEVFRIETAAILDLKWLYENQWTIPTLAAERLESKSLINLNPQIHNLLTLSLDWEYKPFDRKRLVASDSRGDVSLLEYGNTGLRIISSWEAHSFESWICAFDKWNPNFVFTGGDDTFMHIFDISALESATKFLTNKSHIAGVTCFLSHPTKEHILITGSYDETVRVFDTRSMRSSLSEINLKGGIWRLKSDPQDRNLLLCACMYQSFSIVKFTDDFQELELAAEYKEHSSICYGADWCLSKEDNENLVMATCSYYDNKLCISRVTE